MTSGHARTFWNRRYDRPDYLFGEKPNLFLVAQADRLKPGMTALAIADGEGRNGAWLAEQGLKVMTTDIAPRAVQKARALAARRGVSIDAHVVDLDAWVWPEQAFDAVVAIFIQFAGPDLRARLFGRMVQALKPGGLLILQGYTPRQLEFNTGGPGVLENLYTEELLRAEFSALQILDLQVYETELHEGARHAGPSALVGMVARKT